MLILPAEITHLQAPACSRMLAQSLAAEQGSEVVADASALAREGAQFDSSALAVLLECRRDCLSRGKSFFVRGLPARLRNLASLYGVADLLPIAAN
jgi:phospholipid transport system transporter-binding protein